MQSALGMPTCFVAGLVVVVCKGTVVVVVVVVVVTTGTSVSDLAIVGMSSSVVNTTVTQIAHFSRLSIVDPFG